MKRLTLVALIFCIASCVPTPTPTPQPQVVVVTHVISPTPIIVVKEVIVTPQATPTAIPSPTETPVPPTATRTLDANQIKQGIQQTLDLYAQSYTKNDPKLLIQAVDQTNAPFRRLVQTRFDKSQKSMSAGQYRFGNTVVDIQSHDFGFVQARIRTIGGGEVVWLFRQVNDAWVLSEPTSDQVSEPTIIEHPTFTFYTWAWSGEVNDRVIPIMENARARVLNKLGKCQKKKPMFESNPFTG